MKLAYVAAVGLLCATAAANASSYVVTLEQVGSDVVATGSGAIDLTDLSYSSTPAGSASELRAQSLPYIFTGAGGSYDLYLGLISGPSNFGSGGTYSASSSGGDNVGIYTGFITLDEIFVPQGYTSRLDLGG